MLSKYINERKVERKLKIQEFNNKTIEIQNSLKDHHF